MRIPGSRRVAHGVLVLLATGALAACGSSSNGDSNASGGGGGQTAEPPGEGIKSAEQAPNGGDLKVGLPAPPVSLDPTLSSRGGNYVFGTYMETLTHFDNDGKLTKDGLLTDWTREDPTTWRFKLREGVKFTNGEPFDAEAVKFTIEANRDTEGAILATYFGNVETVDVVDPLTVDVKTTTPQFNIPDQLGTVYALPPKYYAEAGKDFAQKPIGTGPFVFDSQKAGQSITVKANPDYWGGKPKLNSITFSFPKDAAQRLALVQSGALDIAFEISDAQARQAQSSKLQVLSVTSSLKQVIFVVANKPPFDDPDLRRAAALAIDRNAIVKGIFQDTNKAEGGFLNTLPGQTVPKILDANMAEAKQLVGTKKPELDMTWVAGFNTGIDEVTSAVRSQLEEAGFVVKPNPTDGPTLIGGALKRELSGIWFYGNVPNVPDANFYVQGLMTTKSIAGNCPHEEWDKLAAEALTKKDAAAAQPIYDQLNTEGVVEENCYIPLYFETSHFAVSQKVGGFEFSPLRYSNFYNTGFTG